MTALPINYAKAPFKDKYIDEETPMFNRWFVFGTHEDDTVDISDSTEDVFTRVPRDVAERILSARDAFCDAIITEVGLSRWKESA